MEGRSRARGPGRFKGARRGARARACAYMGKLRQRLQEAIGAAQGHSQRGASLRPALEGARVALDLLSLLLSTPHYLLLLCFHNQGAAQKISGDRVNLFFFFFLLKTPIAEKFSKPGSHCGSAGGGEEQTQRARAAHTNRSKCHGIFFAKHD